MSSVKHCLRRHFSCSHCFSLMRSNTRNAFLEIKRFKFIQINDQIETFSKKLITRWLNTLLDIQEYHVVRYIVTLKGYYSNLRYISAKVEWNVIGVTIKLFIYILRPSSRPCIPYQKDFERTSHYIYVNIFCTREIGRVSRIRNAIYIFYGRGCIFQYAYFAPRRYLPFRLRC